MNINLKFSMARIMGYVSPFYVHGAYFDRRVLLVPTNQYLKRVLHERVKGGHAAGTPDDAEGHAGKDDRKD